MICAALAIRLPRGPRAQQPPFATTIVDGTENFYVFRYGGAQAMFVVKEGVIATDPIGYRRRQAVTTYLDEIKKVTNQRSGT